MLNLALRTETTKTSPMLKHYVSEVHDIDASFTPTLCSAIIDAYPEAHEMTLTANLHPWLEPYQLGNNRFHIINRNIENYLVSNNFNVEIKKTPRGGFPYVQAKFGRWNIIFTRGDEYGNPRESKFRKQERNQTSLFSEEFIESIAPGDLRCELAHGPKDNDLSAVGYIKLFLIDIDGKAQEIDLLELTQDSVTKINVSPVVIPPVVIEAPEPIILIKSPNKDQVDDREKQINNIQEIPESIIHKAVNDESKDL